jgi:hypothetical protein
MGSEGMAQVVECLPSKCEALNSNPSTAKKQNLTKQKKICGFSINKTIEKNYHGK